MLHGLGGSNARQLANRGQSLGEARGRRPGNGHGGAVGQFGVHSGLCLVGRVENGGRGGKGDGGGDKRHAAGE